VGLGEIEEWQSSVPLRPEACEMGIGILRDETSTRPGARKAM
jgi:hypothetical protein